MTTKPEHMEWCPSTEGGWNRWGLIVNGLHVIAHVEREDADTWKWQVYHKGLTPAEGTSPSRQQAMDTAELVLGKIGWDGL